MALFISLFSLVAASLFTTTQGQFVGGWASREDGGCATGEVSCGTRGPGFSACCPSGTVCLNPVSIPGYTDTTGCCPTGADCSYDLSVNKVCADSSWTLYNNTGLPFCCISGFQGAKGPWYDSCRDTAFPVSETPLPVVTQGTGQIATSAPTSVPAQTTTAPSPSTTSSSGSQQTTTPNASSKLSTGAIAGIVVGGILGAVLIGVLAWWIGRKGGMRRNHGQGEASGFLALGVVPVGGHGSQPPPSYPVGPQELHSKPIVEIGYHQPYPPRNQTGYYQSHVSELA